MSLTRIAMWAMPFIGGRVVGAAAAAAAGGAGAVCAAAKPEKPAASANRAKQRSAVRGDGILLENLLGDMGRSSRRWLGAILSSSRILAEWSGNAKPESRRLSSRTHHQCSFWWCLRWRSGTNEVAENSVVKEVRAHTRMPRLGQSTDWNGYCKQPLPNIARSEEHTSELQS